MDYFDDTEYHTDFSLTSNQKKGGGSSNRKGGKIMSSRKKKQEQKKRLEGTGNVYNSKHIRLTVQKMNSKTYNLSSTNKKSKKNKNKK